MISLEISPEDFESFTEFSDSSFDLQLSIDASKRIIEELKNGKDAYDFAYEDNVWSFANNNTQYSHFDFNEVYKVINNAPHIDTNFFMDIVKCWVGSTLVSGFYMKKARTVFSELIRFLDMSFVFSEEEEIHEKVTDELKAMPKRVKYSLSVSVLNFINYYEEIDVDGIYGDILRGTKDSVSYKEINGVRLLPSSQDIILFDKIVNHFSELTEEDSPYYFKYFPIVFWWKLTTIIPLRPFEFANIPRDGLYKKGEKYYLYLPRSEEKGSKNSKRIQVIKDVPISKELYDYVQKYIDNTERFDKTETLISYPAIEWAYVELKVPNMLGNKLHREYFAYNILYSLLEGFYKEIVYGMYKMTYNPVRESQQESVDDLKGYKKYKELLHKVKNKSDNTYQIQRKLSLGDTRHMALLNLQRLGYHPVEMSRLAGHKNIHTQFGYHSHQQNWVDTEVLKLLATFKFGKIQDDNIYGNGFSGREIEGASVDSEWRDKFILAPSLATSSAKNKLELGYCTDEYQRCPVDDCASGCSYWRIDLEEYKEKREEINEKITTAKSRLEYVILGLLDLHKLVISDQYAPEYSVDNLGFNEKLLRKSYELDECIQQYVELLSIEERKVDYE